MERFLKKQQQYSVNYKTPMLLLFIIIVKKSLEHYWKMMSMYTFSLNLPIRTIGKILATTTK